MCLKKLSLYKTPVQFSFIVKGLEWLDPLVLWEEDVATPGHSRYQTGWITVWLKHFLGLNEITRTSFTQASQVVSTLTLDEVIFITNPGTSQALFWGQIKSIRIWSCAAFHLPFLSTALPNTHWSNSAWVFKQDGLEKPRINLWNKTAHPIVTRIGAVLVQMVHWKLFITWKWWFQETLEYLSYRRTLNN